MADYKDLEVWKASIDLATKIYVATKAFPKEETFGLVSQLRRAAVSVPSNIAEGKGRFSNQEIIHFLMISRGSLNELETQLIICNNIGYVSEEELNGFVEHIEFCRKKLMGLIKYHQNYTSKGQSK